MVTLPRKMLLNDRDKQGVPVIFATTKAMVELVCSVCLWLVIVSE